MRMFYVRQIVLFCCFCLSISAYGFSALVTPPRVEDKVKPGQIYRNIIEITNASSERARFTLATADWVLDAQGGAVFSDALAPGSCRQWVGIEAPEISLGPGAKRRYRYEVQVPQDAPSGECRFAIMVEGEPRVMPCSVGLPVSGRIGVIMYLSVGEAAPSLHLENMLTDVVNGERLPVARIRNDGNAHGRLEGMLDGVDAKGQKFTFVPGGDPIMPGASRDIVLSVVPDPSAARKQEIIWPLKLRGQLDWESRHVEIDITVNK
jgi:hypothetical protein